MWVKPTCLKRDDRPLRRSKQIGQGLLSICGLPIANAYDEQSSRGPAAPHGRLQNTKREDQLLFIPRANLPAASHSSQINDAGYLFGVAVVAAGALATGAFGGGVPAAGLAAGAEPPPDTCMAS
jgi:hypothetical protein